MLKNVSICITMLSIILTTIFLSATAFAGSSQEEIFLKEIRAAVGAGNEEAIWALFNLDGVEEDIKKTLAKHVVKRLKTAKITEIKTEPMPEDFRASYVVNGIKYQANLKLLGRVKILYTREDGHKGNISIPYGDKNGTLRFTGTVKEKLPGNLPPSKQIQVMIIGIGNPPVTFEGYMIYLQGEKPLKDKIEDMGSGNVTRIVRGEVLTYLEVKRTSPKGTMSVTITIDDETVFETGQLPADEPIIYRPE